MKYNEIPEVSILVNELSAIQLNASFELNASMLREVVV